MKKRTGVSQREIAKHWGCSQPYVAKCVKEQGCPTLSLAAADAWRAGHSQRGAGYRSKPAVIAAPVVITPPAGPAPPAPVVHASRVPPPQPLSDRAPISGPAPHPRQPKPGKEPIAGPEPPQKTVRELATMSDRGRLESLELSLHAAIDVETEAHAMVHEAMRDGSVLGAARLPALLGTYNNAKAGRHAAEKAVRALQREERVLLPLEEAKQLVARIWGPHLIRLRALSKKASRANPNNRVFAEEIISLEVEAVIAKTGTLYRQLIEEGIVADEDAPV